MVKAEDRMFKADNRMIEAESRRSKREWNGQRESRIARVKAEA